MLKEWQSFVSSPATFCHLLLSFVGYFDVFPNLTTVKPKAKPGKITRWPNRGSDKNSDKQKASMPDSFPDDICYSYNFKKCTGPCSKKHVCCSCGGLLEEG